MNDQATKERRAASEELMEIMCIALQIYQMVFQIANLARQANRTLAGVNDEQLRLL